MCDVVMYGELNWKIQSAYFQPYFLTQVEIPQNSVLLLFFNFFFCLKYVGPWTKQGFTIYLQCEQLFVDFVTSTTLASNYLSYISMNVKCVCIL